MKWVLPRRIMRWIFSLLITLFILLASHVPADAIKIAFQSSRDFGEFAFKYNIYVMDANGKNLVRLTQGPASDRLPAWSPDGTQIAFVSNRKDGLGLYVMDADGSNLINLTQNPDGGDWSPDWAPDGSQIVFQSRRDGNDEIYVMDADGSNLINLTQHVDFDWHPSWSPDGTKIAFASNRDGDFEIYVMNTDGTNPVSNSPKIHGQQTGPPLGLRTERR